MSSEHGSLINTPKQLIIVALLALIIPVSIAILGSQLMTGSKTIDSTEATKSIESRIKPVGELVQLDGAPPPAATSPTTTSSGAAAAAATTPATTPPAGGAAPAAAATAKAAAPAKPKSGEEVYTSTCTACHAAGIAGAPKTGDKAAWGPRIAQGNATLYKHALEGFKAMPAKGGGSALSDAEVKAAVDYQVAKSK